MHSIAWKHQQSDINACNCATLFAISLCVGSRVRGIHREVCGGGNRGRTVVPNPVHYIHLRIHHRTGCVCAGYDRRKHQALQIGEISLYQWLEFGGVSGNHTLLGSKVRGAYWPLLEDMGRGRSNQAHRGIHQRLLELLHFLSLVDMCLVLLLCSLQRNEKRESGNRPKD